MNVLCLNTTKHPLHISTISCSYRPPKAPLPARDRVIDFGKFKGKMVGTLPSSYLKWVSKTLRAGDTEKWAKLADEVLNDPVYKDRIEWEFAEKVLNGDVLTSPLLQEGERSAVSDLLEISQRFGWDNENKLGWSRINFNLLGTSKGGRIPRVHQLTSSSSKKNVEGGSRQVEEGRRKERRERLRLSPSSSSSNNNGSPLKQAIERMKKEGIEENNKGSFGIEEEGSLKGSKEDIDEDRVVEVQSPFPGRAALLNKVLLNRRKL